MAGFIENCACAKWWSTVLLFSDGDMYTPKAFSMQNDVKPEESQLYRRSFLSWRTCLCRLTQHCLGRACPPVTCSHVKTRQTIGFPEHPEIGWHAREASCYEFKAHHKRDVNVLWVDGSWLQRWLAAYQVDGDAAVTKQPAIPFASVINICQILDRLSNWQCLGLIAAKTLSRYGADLIRSKFVDCNMQYRHSHQHVTSRAGQARVVRPYADSFGGNLDMNLRYTALHNRIDSICGIRSEACGRVWPRSCSDT